jgi:N-acetylmuramoyl-L-alanine amidase
LTFRTPINRNAVALGLIGLLLVPGLSFGQSGSSRRARAQAAYDDAQRMRATLASRPADTRLKAEYEKVIRIYQAVYRHDPSFRRTAVALAAVGELYAEMGRRYSSDHYHQAAIKAYEFLLREYPHAGMSRDGLYTAAEIYRTDLKDPEAARKVYERYVERYPRSKRATEARERIAEIDRFLAEKSAPPSVPSRSGALPQVISIRQWVGPSYTRIVINVEGEVKFDTLRLPNPDRIVLDLANTRLSSALVGKTFPVEDGFLRQVRVGQFQPTVTRVVLDVAQIEDYSIFTLPNPFRLVIDINGPARQKEQIAKREAARPAAKRPEAGKSGVTERASAPQKQPDPAEAANPAATPETNKEVAKVEPLAPPNTSPGDAGPPVRPAAPTSNGSRTLTRALGLKVARVVIDPGHGGHDTGTIGPSGVMEKDVVLDVATRLKQLIEEQTGAEVLMTRTGDTFIPLEERTAIANEKGADLFISIHANASRARSARGIETYFLNFTSDPDALEVAARENATTQESVHQLQNLIQKIAMTEKISESQEFAGIVQSAIHSHLRKAGIAQPNRGVKKAPFVVLIGANMPSILAEISFLTNPTDERLMKRAQHRQKISEALFQGISKYIDRLGGVKPTQQARLTDTPDEAPATDPAADAGKF